MFVVDTNVLIYAANESCTEHGRCRDLLDQWRTQASAWYVTWGILYGFVRVTIHPRVLPHPWETLQAWRFVEALIASPSLCVLTETELHAQVCADVLKVVPQLTGNLITDLHVAVLMKEHGIRTIYTRDADFHRFPFLDVRDPMQVTT
jgi:toxin-antitoxin system PIN domain toxin